MKNSQQEQSQRLNGEIVLRLIILRKQKKAQANINSQEVSIRSKPKEE